MGGLYESLGWSDFFSVGGLVDNTNIQASGKSELNPQSPFSWTWNAFGANQLKAGGQGTGYGGKQSGSDWTMDRDFRGDSKWPWNYHSYTSATTGGLEYGGGQPGTTYTGRDDNHTPYDLGNQA